MDPIILFFLLGIILGLARAEVRLPKPVYDFVSMILLITIGLKGGVEITKQPFLSLVIQIIAVLLMGLLQPIALFPILRKLGKFSRQDAASIAAHYGSVSVGTFAVAIAYLSSKSIEFESYMALFVVVLEIPAILVGILLAKGVTKDTDWGKTCHEVFLGKGVALLVGGLLIGWIAGPKGVETIEPVFFDMFKGVLAIFLLEMGLITALQIGSLRKYGFFLAIFGVIVPICFGAVGVLLAKSLGMTMGGSVVMGCLAASASYIAVPAAMRVSVPQANPTLSLTASLGITFPFNIILGIPLYHSMAQTFYG